MKAIILAAGQGTRLRPLTNDKPKCLVPLLGVSLLERQVNVLKQADINKIHIIAGYLAHQVEIMAKKLELTVSINEHYAETNMVATLFSALPYIEEMIGQNQDLIIAYGDIVYQSENLHALLNCKDEIALMIDKKWYELWSLRLDNPLDDAETFMMDSLEYVVELGKKPKDYTCIQGQYTGLIKIRADKITALIKFYKNLDRKSIYDNKNFDNMYMTSFLQLMIEAGWKVKAVLVNHGWLEVDSIEDIKQYETLAQQGKLDVFYKIAPSIEDNAR